MPPVITKHRRKFFWLQTAWTAYCLCGFQVKLSGNEKIGDDIDCPKCFRRWSLLESEGGQPVMLEK